jgi:hypothetical protein
MWSFLRLENFVGLFRISMNCFASKLENLVLCLCGDSDSLFFHLIHPEASFTCHLLMYLDGWNAFYKAHGNMQTIRYKIELVPEYIASALKHLAKAPSRRVMARYVPPTISTIIRILNECGAIANASKNHFDNVMALLGEVVETTVLRQGLTDEHYRQTKIGLNISRIKQVSDTFTIVQRKLST